MLALTSRNNNHRTTEKTTTDSLTKQASSEFANVLSLTHQHNVHEITTLQLRLTREND